MNPRIVWRTSLAVAFAVILFVATAGQVLAQGPSGSHPPQGGGGQGSEGQGSGKGATKQDQKAVNKDANKLGATAEKTANQLGRDVVFCILAAHTTDVGTAQELKAKFAALTDIPFGQFVAAVIMADRIDKPLDDILNKLKDGESLGQIAREFDVNIGELRQGFGDFRSELARSQTNPPTKDCFSTTP